MTIQVMFQNEIINDTESTIYVEKAIRKRHCTNCHRAIPKDTHHLAIYKDMRTNICFFCLLDFAKIIKVFDEKGDN